LSTPTASSALPMRIQSAADKHEKVFEMRIPRYLPAPVMLFVSFFLASLRPE